ncbi:MAG TPA: hypothetical protein DEF42_00290 [Desulfosporosinus sp.]|nr:hypothetical protein [Desulfosporosinus sp.]
MAKSSFSSNPTANLVSVETRKRDVLRFSLGTDTLDWFFFVFKNYLTTPTNYKKASIMEQIYFGNN